VIVDLVVAELDRMHDRIADRFTRSEPRTRVREYVSGLVAGLERKNGWTLAERAGDESPDGMHAGPRVAAGVPFGWVTADEVYGQAPYLRDWLEVQDVSYVLAIKCADSVITPEGAQRRADELSYMSSGRRPPFAALAATARSQSPRV
jgi:hypothetical protein